MKSITKKANRFPFACIGLFALILILTHGCGPSGQTAKTEPGKAVKSAGDYVFYPPLPNTPRFQYLTTFSNSKDIQKNQSKFFKFVAGDEQEKPKDIAKAYGVDALDGVIYVCDISGKAVVTLDLKKQAFGFLGTKGGGRLSKPVNLKIDKENRLVYVADIGRKQVLVYSLPDGRYIRAYGKQGDFDPSDVDFSADKVFVCDVKGHQVHVLDKDSGETLYKIGKPGSAEGELFHPSNICIKNDTLYVSETNNFRVQLFTLEGKSIGTIGSIGDRPGNFSRPKGIDVDDDGRLYVVDAAFGNVQVFNNQHKLLLFMFGAGPGKENIHLPAGVAVDYGNVNYFKKYLSPKFEAQYLLYVTSNFGPNKVNVYAFGNYKQ